MDAPGGNRAIRLFGFFRVLGELVCYLPVENKIVLVILVGTGEKWRTLTFSIFPPGYRDGPSRQPRILRCALLFSPRRERGEIGIKFRFFHTPTARSGIWSDLMMLPHIWGEQHYVRLGKTG